MHMHMHRTMHADGARGARRDHRRQMIIATPGSKASLVQSALPPPPITGRRSQLVLRDPIRRSRAGGGRVDAAAPDVTRDRRSARPVGYVVHA
jgi:hypothetical protein